MSITRADDAVYYQHYDVLGVFLSTMPALLHDPVSETILSVMRSLLYIYGQKPLTALETARAMLPSSSSTYEYYMSASDARDDSK